MTIYRCVISKTGRFNTIISVKNLLSKRLFRGFVQLWLQTRSCGKIIIFVIPSGAERSGVEPRDPSQSHKMFIREVFLLRGIPSFIRTSFAPVGMMKFVNELSNIYRNDKISVNELSNFYNCNDNTLVYNF